MRWLLRFCVAGMLMAVSLAPKAASHETDPLVSAGDVMQVGLGLVVIVAVIALCALAARRFLNVGPGMSGKIAVLGGLAMGARERIVLIQVGETQLLVGVSPGHMRTLHVLDKPIAPDSPSGKSESRAPQGGFHTQLARYLGGRVSGG